MDSRGEAFKKIRKARNISQKEITQQSVSRTTLSKFENAKVSIAVSTYQYLLDAIDVSAEEFDYIRGNYSFTGKQKIIADFSSLFSTSDTQLINQIASECEIYLEQHFSRSIVCIYKTMQLLNHLELSSNRKINCQTKLYAADIWNELSKIDEWTLLDMKIINCCLHFFEPETYVNLADQLVKRLVKYRQFSDTLPLEASIYLNVTLLFLIDNDRMNAKKYSLIALEAAYKTKRMDYIAISLIRHGIAWCLVDEIQSGRTIAEYLGNEELMKKMEQEVRDFLPKERQVGFFRNAKEVDLKASLGLEKKTF